MRKALKPPQRRYTRVFAPNLSGGMNSVTDSRVLPFSQGEAAYNVCVDSGALINGYGAVSTSVPAAFHKVYYYKVYDEESGTEKGFHLAHNKENGKIYVEGDDPLTWTEIEGAEFGKAPLGVNYRLFSEDVYLLCGEEGMAVIDSSLHLINVPTAPSITSMTMHNERMFVTVGGRRNAVWFSDDLNPTNWNPELDEGGFIELEGEHGRLNKAVAFGGYVYIFGDYGIARLTAFGDQRDFSVTNLFVSSGKIYGNTVTVCGDRIMFLAEDGIYSFDGLTASRAARALDGIIKADDGALGCYLSGKYYLAAHSKDNAQPGNDILIVIDPRTKTLSVNSGFDIMNMSAVIDENGENLLIETGRVYLGAVQKGEKYFGQSLTKLWRSGFGDLGSPDTRKLITEVFLDTVYDCTVKVSTERASKTVKFRGKNEAQRKRINIIGTKVQLEITAQDDISVARPAIKYTVIS